MDIMQRIIDLRTDNDETQRELAKKLDINHIQWANYERRKNELPTRYLIKVCKYYNVSADYILGLPKEIGRAHV